MEMFLIIEKETGDAIELFSSRAMAELKKQRLETLHKLADPCSENYYDLIRIKYSWFMIEDINGDQFETELKSKSPGDLPYHAFHEAKNYFDSLSDHDKNRRNSVYICYAPGYRGIVWLDQAMNIINIK